MTTGNKPFLLTVFGLVLSTGVYAQYAPYPDRGQQPESQSATGPYDKTAVQAQLRLNIAQDVEKVHFIRNNNDPNVVTKAYVLKHADPYEIRPFVRNAVSSRRVESSPTTVECIKYSDGTGVLLVSAEDYRFTDQSKPGMSIDEIVAMLDKPRLTSSSGSLTYLYFPKYFSAEALCGILAKVGANVEGDNVELQYGRDSLSFDTGLNAMLMYVPRYSAKHLERLLKIYDIPSYDVDVRYRLYEVDAENDSKIGLDFQAWKNNGGADLFSVGARFRDGWSANWAGGPNRTGTSNTRFLNFNPKWNTRYLDFLVSKGRAKIATKGSLRINTTMTGTVTAATQLFNLENGEALEAESGVEGFLLVPDSSYAVTATSTDGNTVIDTANGVVPAGAPYPWTITKLKSGNSAFYVIYSRNGRFDNGKERIRVANVSVTTTETDAFGNSVTVDVPWNTDPQFLAQKGFKTETVPSSYGFTLSLTPVVAEKTTQMDIDIRNESLIGWNSDGTPRISRDTGLRTRVMMNNSGETFVIGGLSKRSLVTSDGGIPWLKKLPILGYLFSTESQATKSSRLILVLECAVVDTLNAKLDDATAAAIQKADGKLSGAGVSIPYANTQWGLTR